MDQATLEKPKAERPKVSKKIKKLLKRKKKIHVLIKKAKGRKVALRQQTCVNLPISLKAKLDAACKRLGKKRNRVINELVAKFVGWKAPKKAS